MLAAAVPSFVLPRAALAADVDLLLEVGAKFRTGVRVGRDVTVASLRRMHRAVLIATGAPRGRLLGVPGEAGLDGVCDHVTFARRAASESLGRGEGPAVVVGGSNAAFQCARIAVRLGCEPVTVAYHRAAGRLPADEDQIDDAREEGVRVECLVRPVEVLGRNGRVDAVRFERVREAEPDAWGWRALEADRGELALPAATLVPAVDREADLDWLDGLPEVGRTPLGFLAVDPATAMTAAPGLFAAGDVVGGPKGVVEAVAAGRKAAAAIRRWLEADG
jgi:NADPH-dependent glutamate synthase beta subunit-like oxidoreductase